MPEEFFKCGKVTVKFLIGILPAVEAGRRLVNSYLLYH